MKAGRLLEITRTPLNEVSVFFSGMIILFAIIITINIKVSVPLFMFGMLLLVIARRFKLKIILLLTIMMIPGMISIFLTVILWNDTGGLYATSIKLDTQNEAIYTAVKLSVRSLILSILSVSFAVSIDYEKLTISLMRNLRLSPKIGYALLCAANSFRHLKKDFSNIRNNHLMRTNKKYFSPAIIIPLLVCASRYAYTAGLSIESRGINSGKTFIMEQRITPKDIVFIAVVFVFCAAMINFS